MKLINSKVEIIEQGSDIAGIYKQSATVAHPDIKKLALDLRNILPIEGDCT